MIIYPRLLHFVCSIKDGDVALFVNDSYGNYLALAFDKIYYLNDGSVQKLNDLSSMGKLMSCIYDIVQVAGFILYAYLSHYYAHMAALVVPRLELKR